MLHSNTYHARRPITSPASPLCRASGRESRAWPSAAGSRRRRDRLTPLLTLSFGCPTVTSVKPAEVLNGGTNVFGKQNRGDFFRKQTENCPVGSMKQTHAFMWQLRMCSSMPYTSDEARDAQNRPNRLYTTSLLNRLPEENAQTPGQLHTNGLLNRPGYGNSSACMSRVCVRTFPRTHCHCDWVCSRDPIQRITLRITGRHEQDCNCLSKAITSSLSSSSGDSHFAPRLRGCLARFLQRRQGERPETKMESGSVTDPGASAARGAGLAAGPLDEAGPARYICCDY